LSETACFQLLVLPMVHRTLTIASPFSWAGGQAHEHNAQGEIREDNRIACVLCHGFSGCSRVNNRSRETCPWPANLDAVKAAPETHKVIFENEHVRVLEVTIAPHSKEPIHTHCWPSTLYIQQIGDIIDRDANGKILFDSRQLKEKEKQRAPFVL
jgi:hypothetical protein